jgi:hypothetical protein
MRSRLVAPVLVTTVLLVACDAAPAATPSPTAEVTANAPAQPTTPPDQVAEDIEILMNAFNRGLNPERIERVGRSGDVRNAWYLADLMQFFPRGETADDLTDAWQSLTGVPSSYPRGWQASADYLIANDIPAPPDYKRLKETLFGFLGDDWEPFFADPNGDVDWRLVSWGGVGIDDQPVELADRGCGNCIPALNDPPVTGVAGGDWYPDDRIVFTVEVNGEVRAYPKNIMEVHELVNDTLGGRRIALVYCTLCGTAQAFLTDELPAGIETPTGVLELRTSGLLSRSNKVMFELHTYSLFDTFRGRAVTGPLHDVGLELTPVTVGAARWGDFKQARPDATVIAQNTGQLGTYALDPLGDRDANGPIFPVGSVDPRLLVQEQVLGVRHDEIVVAFPEGAARYALATGTAVEFEGIVVSLVDGALRAETAEGEPITTHQAFWFAWSQFNPDTEVWSPD